MSRSNISITRRELLATAAAAVPLGALAMSGFAKAADKSASPARFKKSLKIGMVKFEGSLEDKFRMLKKIGFDGVELNSPGGPSADEVAKAKEATGLEVPGVVDSVHWRDTLSHPDAKVRARGLTALKEALRMTKKYGGTSVLLVPAKVDKLANYEQCWERSIAEIRKAAPLAEEIGIHILIENVWNDFLTSPAETARYLDEIDSKMVGAYFDVGNAVRYAPPVEWVRTLGKRIVKLDIKEFDLDKGKEEGWYKGFQVKLLEGDCNWPLVMDELEKLGIKSWGSAEVPGGGPERLADISQRMDRIFAS